MTEQVTLMVDLPRVITGVGAYVTRSGNKAVIDRIDDHPEVLSNGFAAKGTLYLKREVRTVRKYTIWHVSGSRQAVGQHPNDIVGPWIE